MKNTRKRRERRKAKGLIKESQQRNDLMQPFISQMKTLLPRDRETSVQGHALLWSLHLALGPQRLPRCSILDPQCDLPRLLLVYPTPPWSQCTLGGSRFSTGYTARALVPFPDPAQRQPQLAPKDGRRDGKDSVFALSLGPLFMHSLTCSLTYSFIEHTLTEYLLLQSHRSQSRGWGSGSGTPLGAASSHHQP